MTKYDEMVNNLSIQDKEFLSLHSLNTEVEFMSHIERLSEVSLVLSLAMLESFSPVIEAFHQFLGDVPKSLRESLNNET